MSEIKETLAFKELTPEEKEKRGILGRLYGPCADFLHPTRNGRTYSDELWEKVFNENELVKEAFENGGIPGELDHPVDRTDIDSSKIAIIMPEPPKKDKDGHLIAYFDILDTPNGRIAYQLAKYGYKLGISSRGNGDVDEYDDSVIPESYDFKCFDLVLTPSVKDARLVMTESLDENKINFKKALKESLDSADPDAKVIMEETLDKLHIDLKEDKEEEESSEVEAEVEETPAEVVPEEQPSTEEQSNDEETEILPEESGDEYHDKIKQFLALIYTDDTAPTEEETNAFVQAFVSIFPEECFNFESCTDKEEIENSEEISQEPEEATDDGSEELIKSLQDSLKEKSELEAQVKSLQEQLAVSDTEVNKLKEENGNYKGAMIRLTEAARESKTLTERIKSLEEDLEIKQSKITELTESKSNESSEKEKLSESLNDKDVKINSLNEQLKTLSESKDSEIKELKENLDKSRQRFEKQKKLVEQYKSLADDTAQRYIQYRADMLGVNSKDITSRLPREGYEIADVDRICEDLQEDSLGMNSLPFNIKNNNIKKVQMVESKKDNLCVNPLVDDDVDESLMGLAGLK